jgi:hypothetical protein
MARPAVRRHGPPGGVDVNRDALVRILGLQEEKLRNDQVGDYIIDGSADEDDVVFQEAGINVVGTVSTIRLVDDHRHKRSTHFSALRSNCSQLPVSSTLDQCLVERSHAAR